MRGPQRHPSVGRRTLDVSLTWLIVGAMIGAIGGLRTGRLVELASGVLGGMIVLPIAGVLLGLIGGDAKGSVVGAVGGMMGCWLAKPTGGISIDAVSVEVVVVFAALVGATCLLYLQFVRWSYGILLRRACQMVGGAFGAVQGTRSRRLFRIHERRRRRNSAHFHSRPGRRRAQPTQHGMQVGARIGFGLYAAVASRLSSSRTAMLLNRPPRKPRCSRLRGGQASQGLLQTLHEPAQIATQPPS